MGDVAERRRGSRRCTSARPATSSLRRLQTDHIDLYQMHHVDRRHAVGGDLAGDGAARAPGQGALRRQQQLRRLAHRAGQRGRPRRAASSASSPSRASTTCSARTVELEVAPGLPRPTASASSPGARSAGGLLGGCSAEGDRGPARRRARCSRLVEKHRDQLEAYEALCARARRAAGRRRPRVAAAPPGGHRADHRPAHARAARRRACARSSITLEPDDARAARRDLPRARRRRPRRRTPGSRRHRHRSFDALTRSPRSAGTRSDQGDDDQREPTPRSGGEGRRLLRRRCSLVLDDRAPGTHQRRPARSNNPPASLRRLGVL